MPFFRTLDSSFAILRTGTLVFITFLATTSQYFVLWPWAMDHSGRLGPGRLLLFNVAVVFIFWTFYLACQDPGKVTESYVPPEAASGCAIRYCQPCHAFKPPRTHHCRSCGRCILRMDHHCPWLSGCVGYYNHAAFIKFLAWVVPTTGWLSYMMGSRLYDVYCQSTVSGRGSNHDGIDSTAVVVASLNCIMAGFTCIMVSGLLFYQVWCVSENITTIESWNKKRTEEMIRRKRIPPIDFPYDLYSSMENFRELFGHHASCLLWFWPPTKATGTGHTFPLNEDADVTRPWPPALPSTSSTASSAALSKSEAHCATGSGASRSGSAVESRGVLKSRLRQEDEADEYTYEDYANMGLISDSEDSDDYVDGDGEYLDNYGVDDDEELTTMNAVVEDGLTMAQLLSLKRAEQAHCK